MDLMELGTSGTRVSPLALGCMSLEYDIEKQSKQTVLKAFELGINFYDTADVYGRGDSEQILGAALREGKIPRDQVVIASKCGIVFPGMVEAYTHKAYDLSANYLKSSCEASLRRLETDYIDLYQPHRIDYMTHPDETARALEELRTEGKILHAGVSNYTVGEIRALSASIRLESLQTKFSLLELEPLETDLAAVCLEMKMSVLCYSPNHGGVLAGRPLAHGDWQEQREQGVVTQATAFAEQYGITLSQLSLAWLLQLPGGVVPLVGTANPGHLSEAAAAIGVTLDRDDWYELLVIARGRPMPWRQRPYFSVKDK